MGLLADVNVLVALLHDRHASSARAVAWLEHQDRARDILVCRVAQMGLLRVLTNPAWMKQEARSAADVWMAIDRVLADERFAYAEEPPGLEAQWRRLTRSLPAGRCADTDTYLAAFAIAGRHRLLTLDRGFRGFRGLEVAPLG